MRYARVLKFAAVGVANTAIDFGLFNLLLWAGVHRTLANVAGISVALLFSYAVNSRWTFGSDRRGWRTMAAFVAVTALGMGLNTGLVALLGDPGRFPDLPYAAVLVPNAAKLLAAVFSMTWNYLGYARLVFRDRTGGSGETVG